MLNYEKVRSEFPILSRTNRGKKMAYLDNAASSQKPRCVIESINEYYSQFNSNIHRGVYELAEESEAKYWTARETIANWFGVSKNEIIFTRGTTEALNLVANSLGRKVLTSGDVVVLSEMEHHANIVPWQMICSILGAKIEVVPILEDGSLDLTILNNLITREEVKILSLCSVSNTLGTNNPIQEITEKAHLHNTLVVVDGAQSVPHERTNLRELDCDFFAFSGHKVFGPMGIGVLFGKEKILNELPPYQGGGDMIEEVQFEGTTYASVPQRFEAGTPNVAGTVGLGQAFRFLEEFDMFEIKEHEKMLLNIARDGLSKINGFIEHGTTPTKSAVLSFTIDQIHPHDLSSILDAEGIAIRTGHHCCQPLMKTLGVEATARASFAFYNTPQEAEKLVEAVEKTVNLLR